MLNTSKQEPQNRQQELFLYPRHKSKMASYMLTQCQNHTFFFDTLSRHIFSIFTKKVLAPPALFVSDKNKPWTISDWANRTFTRSLVHPSSAADLLNLSLSFFHTHLLADGEKVHECVSHMNAFQILLRFYPRPLSWK